VLQDIINLIKKNLAAEGAEVQTNQVDPLDMQTVIMPNMCKILAFYTIASDACPDNDIKVVQGGDEIQPENSAKGGSRLKIVLIILGILVGIFVILVIIFAVRAKMNQEKETEEETPPE
jgi:hypothetical protein